MSRKTWRRVLAILASSTALGGGGGGAVGSAYLIDVEDRSKDRWLELERFAPVYYENQVGLSGQLMIAP